jgi:hypothetical protein
MVDQHMPMQNIQCTVMPCAERCMVVEQITKADRDTCHALCRNGKARATLRPLSFTVKLK